MSQTKIQHALRQAFFYAVADAVGNTALENEKFDSSGREKWYAFTFIPSPPQVLTLGAEGEDLHSGIVQIDLCIPHNKSASGIAADVEKLALVFVAGNRLKYDDAEVLVKTFGRNGAGRKLENCYKFTCSIYWEARIRRATFGDLLNLHEFINNQAP